MKGIALSLVVLTMNVAPAIAQKIGTETSDRTSIVHLKTALNHLTVIEVSEPVTEVAAGSPTFKVEWRDNKVLARFPYCRPHIYYGRLGRMSHPDPHGPPDRTPIKVGEVWENPVTGERAMILERPWDNPAGRATAELTALVGARVVGEHRHPALVEQFTVLEGELTVKRNKQTSILHQGETAVMSPGAWHDWWNASTRDARVRVEITPGERFVHLIETFYGLARLGHTDRKGMPYPLQLALSAQEFSDVIVFRSPPLAVQRAIFGALAPIARWRGYRATYPQLSRIVLAPRT